MKLKFMHKKKEKKEIIYSKRKEERNIKNSEDNIAMRERKEKIFL